MVISIYTNASQSRICNRDLSPPFTCLLYPCSNSHHYAATACIPLFRLRGPPFRWLSCLKIVVYRCPRCAGWVEAIVHDSHSASTAAIMPAWFADRKMFVAVAGVPVLSARAADPHCVFPNSVAVVSDVWVWLRDVCRSWLGTLLFAVRLLAFERYVACLCRIRLAGWCVKIQQCTVDFLV